MKFYKIFLMSALAIVLLSRAINAMEGRTNYLQDSGSDSEDLPFYDNTASNLSSYGQDHHRVVQWHDDCYLNVRDAGGGSSSDDDIFDYRILDTPLANIFHVYKNEINKTKISKFYNPIIICKNKDIVLNNCFPAVPEELFKLIFGFLTSKEKSFAGNTCLRFSILCGQAIYSPYLDCLRAIDIRESITLNYNFDVSLYSYQDNMDVLRLKFQGEFLPLDMFLIQDIDAQMEHHIAEDHLEDVVLSIQEVSADEDANIKNEKNSTQG